MSARFIGAQKVYGDDFSDVSAWVIGVGGVGSWAAEALGRSGVGNITLIDADVASIGNINRQLVAQNSTIGHDKIAVAGARLLDINPDIKLALIDDFLSPCNAKDLLPMRERDLPKPRVIVLDCCDDSRAKLAIALHCHFNKIKLITSGGAGGKTDVSAIKFANLSYTRQDPLLAKLRANLKSAGVAKFSIGAVYVDEQARHGKLDCAGAGSAVAVTASMGMMMAGMGLRALVRSSLI